MKSGVSAPAESILSSLLRTDTAAAFNISMQDVHGVFVEETKKVVEVEDSSSVGGLDGDEEDEVFFHCNWRGGERSIER